MFENSAGDEIEVCFDDIVAKTKDVQNVETEIEIESKGAKKEAYEEFVAEMKDVFPDLQFVVHGKLKRLIEKLGYEFTNKEVQM